MSSGRSRGATVMALTPRARAPRKRLMASPLHEVPAAAFGGLRMMVPSSRASTRSSKGVPGGAGR